MSLSCNKNHIDSQTSVYVHSECVCACIFIISFPTAAVSHTSPSGLDPRPNKQHSHSIRVHTHTHTHTHLYAQIQNLVSVIEIKQSVGRGYDSMVPAICHKICSPKRNMVSLTLPPSFHTWIHLSSIYV